MVLSFLRAVTTGGDVTVTMLVGGVVYATSAPITVKMLNVLQLSLRRCAEVECFIGRYRENR